MPEIYTDCKTDIGIVVGIVDTIINQCRLFKRFPKEIIQTSEVQETLKDLFTDKDFAFLRHPFEEDVKEEVNCDGNHEWVSNPFKTMDDFTRICRRCGKERTF